MKYGVIVHGGADDAIPDEEVEAFKKGIKKACERAYELLEQGKSALDAVEEAVCILENDPTYDAGKGSFVNERGDIEMDAIIATDNYQLGVVCAIRKVKNPIKVARKVMEKTKHVMLGGAGASEFARENGMECEIEELIIEREKKRHERHLKNYDNKVYDESKEKKSGTVGCICLDKTGKMAIGGSTGGSPLKMVGRVGDTALWGSGTYLEAIGGATTTGLGEKFIKVMVGRQAIDYLREGYNAQEAAEKVIKLLEEKVKGKGGIIILSKAGVGAAYNTKRMAYAYKTDKMMDTEVRIENDS
jgi:beta-aspartyl-peptidase (threonine type)